MASALQRREERGRNATWFAQSYQKCWEMTSQSLNPLPCASAQLFFFFFLIVKAAKSFWKRHMKTCTLYSVFYYIYFS